MPEQGVIRAAGLRVASAVLSWLKPRGKIARVIRRMVLLIYRLTLLFVLGGALALFLPRLFTGLYAAHPA